MLAQRLRHWIDLLLETADPLQAKYAHYNALLFDGILPTIPIKWAIMKTAGGVANAKLTADPSPRPATPLEIRLGLRDKYAGRKVAVDSISIKLSSSYKRSEQATDAILIHEMIHVYFFVTDRPGENHGSAFLKQVARCSKLVGFTVPIKDSVDGLELNDKLASKLIDLGVIYGRKKSSDTEVYAIFPAKVVRDQLALMTEKVSWNLKYNYWSEGWIGTISSAAWSAQSFEVPVQRKWSGRFFFLRNATLSSDLKQNGVELFSSRIEGKNHETS